MSKAKKPEKPVPMPDLPAVPPEYRAPETRYFKTKAEFDEAVGRDFIIHANMGTEKGGEFLVGLAHGISPSGAYAYILENFDGIKRPDLLRFTFTNSRLRHQRDLEDIVDAREFLRQMIRRGHITTDQIFGRSFRREHHEEYAEQYNKKVGAYLKRAGKHGYDYVFLASDPAGRIAAITRNSTAFDDDGILTVVHDRTEKELTATPQFLLKSQRVAFLATKSDKRRSLAWLFSVWGSERESPSFIRFMDEVETRMTVFIDDQALTWPQIELVRQTNYGPSTIRIDLANPYNEKAKKKLPVILLIHGFLGLNSFDGLLTSIPSHKYITAAMHYGSVPNDLPPELYSHHVVRNIDFVANHFGSLGHPVYIFDHSMGNIYFMMIDRSIDKLTGIKNHLRGRIGANPFFGEEAKHALLGFLDTVILPAMSLARFPGEKSLFLAARGVIPLDTKKAVRRRGIRLTKWLIEEDSTQRERTWQAAKERILYLMSNMGSLPHLNRIPIRRALNRLPAKIFAIQVHSALQESKNFDRQKGLVNIPKYDIPILIIKSDKDGVARFVDRIYDGKQSTVIDVTQKGERDLFKEHLFHMVDPVRTTQIIEEFIDDNEKRLAEKA